MNLFQILACNDTLGTCCSDYGLVSLIDIIRTAFSYIQLIIPIILIVMITVQLIKLTINPEEKNGTKKITNKLIGAIICFFLPILIDIIVGWMPSNQQFQVASCWQEAKISHEVLKLQKSTYIKQNDDTERKSLIINPGKYNPGNPTTSENTTGSSKGKEIVNYAKKFVGKNYIYGGYWNGELPYTGTDCSGFVQGIYKHFGINLQRTTYAQWDDTGSYTLVNEANVQAGDLIMYDGHVAIATGNGREIVHAQSTATGIVISSDYKTCSSKAILGIMRIKGIN